MLEEFLTAKKQRDLYIYGVILLSLNAIVWTKGVLASIMSYTLFGELDVATILAAVVLYGTFKLYKHKLG